MRKLYRKQKDGAGWLVQAGGGYRLVRKRRTLTLVLLAKFIYVMGGKYWYGWHMCLLTAAMHAEYSADGKELDKRIRRENAWFNYKYREPAKLTMPSYLARLKFRQQLNQALIKLGRMTPANKLVI